MNAFTLFGELQVGTSRFESSLYEAEVRLNKTEKAIADTERRSKQLAQTNAVTARSYEKLAASVKQNRDRMQQALDAYQKGEISQRRLESVLRQTDSRLNSVNSRLKDHVARLNDAPSKLQQFGSGLMDIGKWATVGTLAIGTFTLKSGMNVENLRNKFQALEGSLEKANDRIEKLKELSRGSVGVSIADALEARGFLAQPSLKVSEQAIDGITKALGRLKLGFSETMQSSTDFLINMQQLFAQGFEAPDIKQAIGRVPIFEELLKQAFGTSDPEKLRALKDAGKLTMDSFIGGLAEAVNTNPNLSLLKETFSIRLSKLLSEVDLALAPLGQKLIDTIQPEMEKAMTSLQKGNYAEIGDSIGQQLGRAIGRGIVEGIPSLAKAVQDKIKTDMKGITVPIGIQGTVSVGKGLLEGLGFEASLKGAQEALVAFTKNVTTQWTNLALWFPTKIAQAFKAVVDKINSFAPPARAAAFEVGANTGDGFVAGLQSRAQSIANAATSIIGQLPIGRAMEALKEKSPSLVFFEIGANVAQGFVDGVNAGKPKVTGAITSMIDLPAVKRVLASQIKELQKELTGLKADTAILESGRTTTLRNQVADLNRVKNTLDELLQLRQELGVHLDKPLVMGPTAMREIATLNSIKESIGSIVSTVKEFTEVDDLTRIIETFADPKAANEIKRQADALGLTVEHFKTLAKLAATSDLSDRVKDLTDITPANRPPRFANGGTGSDVLSAMTDDEIAASIETNLKPPPALKPAWEDFWATMRANIGDFKNGLPSIKEAIGTNLLDSLAGVADVIGYSIARADGTLKGFFTSIAQGFGRMAQSIIGDLVRILVYKSLLNLFGSLAGGIGGAATAPAGATGPFGMGLNFASGGFTGIGGKWQPAGIVHKGEYVIPRETVGKLGVRFFDALVKSRIPAMATGGYMAREVFVPNYGSLGTVTNNTTTNQPMVNHFHFHNNNSNATFAKQSAEQAAKAAIGQLNRTAIKG